MKKLYAHWCYYNNFGDALNPYLLHKLSGCKIVYCNYIKPIYKNEITLLVKDLIRCRRPDLNRFVPPTFRQKKKIILAIGSILSRSLPNFQIWGAGYMNEFEHAQGGVLHAVRGPYSAEKLYKEGFPLCETYGDPALLLPLVFSPNIEKNADCGIIPHLKDYDYFKHRYPEKNIIYLGENNIESIIKKILSCRYIISTSLHGVIVAHAYGIPALWIKQGDINTDGIKFKDYFASVGIPTYIGNFNIDKLLSDNKLPYSIENLMYPKISILEIQRKLINVCPFNILPNITSKLNKNL